MYCVFVSYKVFIVVLGITDFLNHDVFGRGVFMCVGVVMYVCIVCLVGFFVLVCCFCVALVS